MRFKNWNVLSLLFLIIIPISFAEELVGGFTSHQASSLGGTVTGAAQIIINRGAASSSIVNGEACMGRGYSNISREGSPIRQPPENQIQLFRNGTRYTEGPTFTGVSLSGEYKQNGAVLSGISPDGIMYDSGRKFTGLHQNGKLYSEGALATAVFGDSFYKNGEKFSGMEDGRLYQNGQLFSGVFTDGQHYAAGMVCPGEGVRLRLSDRNLALNLAKALCVNELSAAEEARRPGSHCEGNFGLCLQGVNAKDWPELRDLTNLVDTVALLDSHQATLPTRLNRRQVGVREAKSLANHCKTIGWSHPICPVLANRIREYQARIAAELSMGLMSYSYRAPAWLQGGNPFQIGLMNKPMYRTGGVAHIPYVPILRPTQTPPGTSISSPASGSNTPAPGSGIPSGNTGVINPGSQNSSSPNNEGSNNNLSSYELDYIQWREQQARQQREDFNRTMRNWLGVNPR